MSDAEPAAPTFSLDQQRAIAVASGRVRAAAAGGQPAPGASPTTGTASAPPEEGSRERPFDDTAHAADASTIARASLAPDPAVQLKRYATAFNQPVGDFAIIGDSIVRRIPGTDRYGRVAPSVRGATGPLDAAERAFDWVAGEAGQAFPAAGASVGLAVGGLSGLVTGPGALGMASLGAGAGASLGDIARQKLDAYLAPDGQEAPMDWGSVVEQGAGGVAAPLLTVGGSKLVGGLAPIVREGLKDVGRVAAAESGIGASDAAINSALREGTTKIAAKGAGADALAQRIKSVAQAEYKRASDAGVIISPESFGKFAEELPDELNGYHPVVNEQAARIVKMLQGEAKEPMTLDKLDSLRSVASGISAGRDLNEARIAGNIVGKIDDFIDNLKPTDLVGEPGADVDAAAGALNNARGMWRTYSKMKTINDITDTGEMLNDQNWVKGRFRALVKSSQFDRFTPEEQDAIANVARTGKLEKAVKMIPWRAVQMMSTYAEPMMQDAKIGAVQRLIAEGAPEVADDATAGEIPRLSFDVDRATGKIIPAAAQAAIAEGEGQAGRAVNSGRSPP